MLNPLINLIERCSLFYNWGPAIPFRKSRIAKYQDVWFTTSDNLRLHGHFYPCPKDWPKPFGEHRPVVVFFHGNAGAVKRWRHVGSRWQDAIGADVLLVDYRGYGLSAGHPTEQGLYSDAHAAYAWLIEEKGYESHQIVIVGQSLGGAVAMELASCVDHAALVLESTFTCVQEVANALLFRLPLGRLMRNQFPSLDRIRGYQRPVFISHGDQDRLIPVSQAHELYSAAVGLKHLMIIPGMGHHDARKQNYNEQVSQFLLNALHFHAD